MDRHASVRANISDGVLELLLNRPEMLNVLDVEARREILSSLKENEDKDEVRCVVFRSTGRAFSAGADVRHLRSLDRNGGLRYTRFVQKFLSYVENYPKPTIGVAEGIAVGGGLELLMALDILVATREARFGQTELNVGMIPGGGGTQRLPRIVGIRRAKEMLFTGSLIDAETAERFGLVSRVVDKEKLHEALLQMLSSIKKKSPLSLRLAKEATNQGFRETLSDGLKRERKLYLRALMSNDGKEGMDAFLEKREPRYKGS